MYGENHPPDDVRDVFQDMRARWRVLLGRWMVVSPTQWSRALHWGIALPVGAMGFLLAWSIWWLVGLPVWATLKQDLDAERRALSRANDAARRLPELVTRLRNAEAETIAWRRLLPIVRPLAQDDTKETGDAGAQGRAPRQSRDALPSGYAGVVDGIGTNDVPDAADGAGADGADNGDEAGDDAHTRWRTDIEHLVVRAGVVLEFARPGPSEVSADLEIERAEVRVRGTVANLLGWLAAIDEMPRFLVVSPLSLQGPRMSAEMPVDSTGASVERSERNDATLTVMVSAYRWRRPAVLPSLTDGALNDESPKETWPALPVPPPRWQTPTDTVDVFRTPLTRRAAQDAVTMAAAPPPMSADDARPVGTMRAGDRYVVLRRSVSNGKTALDATWSYGHGVTPAQNDAGVAQDPKRASKGSSQGEQKGEQKGASEKNSEAEVKIEAGSAPEASTVDVLLHGVDAADALRAFARLTGRSVVIGERVSGRLDMDVQGVAAATAFDVMIRSAGLGVQSVSGVDWVAPRADLLADEQTQLEAASKREALLPLAGRRFTLNYPRALALREIILGEKDSKGQRLLSPRGSLIADPRTNQFFVTDLPERLDALASFIARIDVPVRQVLIEARIVEADDRFSESLGVRLSGYHGDSGKGQGGANRSMASDGGGVGGAFAANGATDGTGGGRSGNRDGSRGDTSAPGSTVDVGLPAAMLAGVTPPSLAITLFGRSASRFLQLELSALETSGRGRVVSRPRVVTADKVQALIEQGTELPYQTRNGRRNAASVQFRKATLRLEVTPLITPDGQVILDVDVRKDSVGQAVAEGFAIDTRHVRTQVQVENGGTVAIGGIYQEVRRDNRAAVPWLGEVPVLGALFRNRANEDRRTELLVFLTPSVVPEGGASHQRGEAAQAEEHDRPERREGHEMREPGEPGERAEKGEWGERPVEVDAAGRLNVAPAGRSGASGTDAGAEAARGSGAESDDLPPGHPRLLGVFPEMKRSARPTQIPVSSGIGTQISAIYAGKRNTCRTDGGGQDHGWTRSGTTSRTAVL